MWSNGAAHYYGTSPDGVNFTIQGTIQDLPFGVNDVRIDGGTIEFYGTANVGNVNWSFGNAVIQHATAPLPKLAPTEFPINTTTDGDQSEPSVTALIDGRFVASWSSLELSSGTFDIRGRVFNGDGTPAGDDFVINSIKTAQDHLPNITGLPNGGFVATWQHTVGDDDDIHGQVFGADGVPAGVEFVVNTTAFGRQQGPTTTSLADGRFVVAWYGDGAADHTYDITARIFNADGTHAGEEFTVNTRSGSYEYVPSITGLSDGRFVVTWHYSDWGGIQQARIFNADGTPAGDEFSFADTAFLAQDYNSSVMALNNGRFAIVWERHASALHDGQGEIYGRFFQPDGTATGSEFVVNTKTLGDQTNAAVTTLSDGRLMVSWLSDSEEGGTYAIRGRLFNTNGSPAGDDFVVNTTVGVGGSAPSIDALSNGHFVVTWQSPDGGGSSSYDIHGIVLQAEPGNQPPQAVDDSGMHIPFNTPTTFSAADLLANDTDAENDPLSIVAVSGATHGSVVLDAGNPVFTSAGNFSGAASFNYTVSDGHATSTATVHFTVDAPAQTLIWRARG